MQNLGVKCSVQECKYNSEQTYCTLEKIQVGTHEANPSVPECTDCQSFELK